MAKRILSTTLAVIMFLCAIVVASFGSRAAKIEQAGAGIVYVPTNVTATTNVTSTTAHSLLMPGHWFTTSPYNPFNSAYTSPLTTTQPSTEATTSDQTTSESETTEATTTTTTTTITTTTITTTTATTTTTTTTTKPTTTTTTTRPTTTTTKPTTTSKPINIDSNNAKYAILYDVTNGKILFEKNAYTRCYPASTTKLLTASVALYYMNENTLITVGDELDMIAFDSSVCGIQKGYVMTLSQLIMGLIISSGNDAAYTIAVNVARHVSGNPNMSNTAAINYFASLMNSYAKNIGAKSSNFVNPDGYPVQSHYSTAYDLMLIARDAMKYSTIKKAGETSETTIVITSASHWITFRNTNSLINKSSQYYYPSATGLKTGMTYDAGYCLISTATKNGKTLLAVALGSASDGGRYIDTINMFNAAF